MGFFPFPFVCGMWMCIHALEYMEADSFISAQLYLLTVCLRGVKEFPMVHISQLPVNMSRNKQSTNGISFILIATASLSFQHDVSQTLLKATLDSVVEECVSFVGVDINICSEVLLRWDKSLTC